MTPTRKRTPDRLKRVKGFSRRRTQFCAWNRPDDQTRRYLLLYGIGPGAWMRRGGRFLLAPPSIIARSVASGLHRGKRNRPFVARDRFAARPCEGSGVASAGTRGVEHAAPGQRSAL